MAYQKIGNKYYIIVQAWNPATSPFWNK